MNMDNFNILAGVAGFISLGLAIAAGLAYNKRKTQKARTKGKNSPAIIGNSNTVNKGENNTTNPSEGQTKPTNPA